MRPGCVCSARSLRRLRGRARPGRLRLGRARVHARGELVFGVVCVLVLEMPAGVRLHVLGAVVWGSPERCARAPVTPR